MHHRNSSKRKLRRRIEFLHCLQQLEPRRLLAVAGSLDPSFSDDGLASFSGGGVAWTANAVAVQTDGKTVVAGASGFDVTVVRFNVDGTPDTTFGPTHNGSVFTHVGNPGQNSEARAVAIQQDGKIVVAGSSNLGADAIVLRYNADGTLDKTFDGDGIKTVDFGVTSLDARFNAITIQSDGKIVVAGDDFQGLLINDDDDFGVARLNTNGSLDSSFDGDGKATVDFGAEEVAYGVAIDYSGTPATNPRYGGIVLVGDKTVFAGTLAINSSFAVARLTKGGGKDNSFDGDGKATTAFPAKGYSGGRGVLVQSDGRIVVAGSVFNDPVPTAHDFALVRYNPSGSLDTLFGVQGTGRVVADLGGGDDAYGIAVSNADGEYLVGGGSDNKFAVLKVGTDGRIDGSFGTSGHVITGFGGPAMGIAAGPGRRFVIAGGPNFKTARYLEAGANLVHATAAFDPNGSEAGQNTASFFVFREEKLPTPLRVYFSVGGEASAPRFGRVGGDYTADGLVFPIPLLGGDERPYVDIPANQSVATVIITPRDDTLAEGVEHAVFTILPDAAYEVGAPSAATLAILDNDGGSISGTAFIDVNNNHVQDVSRSEGGIAGITIYADADNDKVLDAGERVTTTDADGHYTLPNLAAASYVVRQILPSGYTQLFPISNFGIHITLAQDQVLTGQNFADAHPIAVQLGSIAGTIYNDLDGDGVKDSLETGIAGRTVYIDANNNSKFDTGEKSAVTSSSGAYKISSLGSGTLKVREVAPSGWAQTSPASNGAISVTLTAGQNVTGKNFFVRPTTGGSASIAGNVFHDFNRNAKKDTGDTNLSAWTVYIDLDNDKILDTNEQRVITDSAGNYLIGNLAAGTYKIRVVLQSGYVQTLPTGGFGNNATLTSGQKATGKNFGVDN